MSPNFTLIFSAIVTLSTVVYAVLTALLVRETRRMRQVQTEPRIDITHKVREEWIGHVEVVVANIGLGPAYDVRFRAEAVTDDAETRELIRELMEINFVRSGLHYLSPGQRASSFLTNLSENPRWLRSAFRVTATYASAEGKRYKDEYLIDLSEFVGLRRVGEPPLHKMAKAIEALQVDVHELADPRARANRLASRP